LIAGLFATVSWLTRRSIFISLSALPIPSE
jgi:hypothetical protein